MNKAGVLSVVLLLSICASQVGAVPQPKLEMLFENNVTSTGSVVDTAQFWYDPPAGHVAYVPGMGGTAFVPADSPGDAAYVPRFVANGPANSILTDYKSVTISAWIKLSRPWTYENNGGYGNDLYNANYGEIRMYVEPGALNGQPTAYNASWNVAQDGYYNMVDQWQFLALTWSGVSGLTTWYWSDGGGALQSAVSARITTGMAYGDSTTPFFVGGRCDWGDNNVFPGAIDDFRIWTAADGSAVLGDQELRQVMGSHTSIPEPVTLTLLGLGVLGLRMRRRG